MSNKHVSSVKEHLIASVKDVSVDATFSTDAGDVYDIRIPHKEDITLMFQKGDPNVVGVNGVSNEALLAIVQHRLQQAQAHPDTVTEANDNIIMFIRNALDIMKAQKMKEMMEHLFPS